MREDSFNEPRESLTEALEHAQGKIQLKTKRGSTPEPPKPLSTAKISRLCKRKGGRPLYTVMDELGTKAKMRGLTPEKLSSALNDE